jgi:hypothetical protein
MREKVDKLFEKLLDGDSVSYFLALCIITILMLWAKKSLVENETVAFQILQEDGRFGPFRILNTLQFLSIPIIYAYKFTLIAFVLWVGAFMFGYKISFSQMWKVATISEVSFLLPEFIKIIYFIMADFQPTILDVKAFYPLSMIGFFDYDTLSLNWHYPLKALNLFEVLYWFILVEAIHVTTHKRWSYAVAIVFTSYVFFFFVWLLYYVLVYN